MANPPSYEESVSEFGRDSDGSRTVAKVPQHLSIREEVGASRSQHVAALVAKLLPQIRERAKSGLSKTTVALLPSNQASSQGQMVGWNEEDPPILIQLDGPHDTIEFWTQQEALDQLKSQLFAAVSDSDAVVASQEPLPARPTLSSATSKSSLFGRKSRVTEFRPTSSKPVKAPVTIDVQLDELFFRSETPYGLFETLTCRCVLLAVDIR